MRVTLNGARRTIRTVFQMLVGAAAMAPFIYSAATQHDAKEATGWAAVALGIAAAVTRVMAMPAVEDFLQRWLPWLSAKAPQYAVPVDDENGLVPNDPGELPAADELPTEQPGAEPTDADSTPSTPLHQGA